MSQQLQLLPANAGGGINYSLAAALAAPLDRAAYNTECAKRWHGHALRNAQGNWDLWQEVRPLLNEGMLKFRTQGKSLTEFLWDYQTEITPGQSNLYPLLDFCDHYQKVHLRRGLVIYCKAILRLIETHPHQSPPTRP